MVRIVFSDIDGTLLTDDKRVTAKTEQAVKGLVQRGIPFVLVSARMPEAIYPITDKMGVKIPLISYSGALVLTEEGQELYSLTMKAEQTAAFLEAVEAHFPQATVNYYAGHHWFVREASDPRVVFEMKITEAVAEVRPFADCLQAGVLPHKILLMMEPADCERAERELQALFPALASANPTGEAIEHLVILGDLHLPGNNLDVKKRMLSTINSWGDVSAVVAVGDLCENEGAADEYAQVREFFSVLEKPLFPVTGNHDFIYASFGPGKRSVRADADTRDEKLGRFREAFGLERAYYSRATAGYRLVFLSADSPGHLAELSPGQLEWLRAELDAHRQQPTIVFFHAPLDGTLRNYNRNANTANFVAQPSAIIREILSGNPQVFLWVSGHTHTSPREESFASAINVFDQRVANIHNADMKDRAVVWTNSLFLHPDRVLVRTFDHAAGAWMPSLDREFPTPAR